MPWQHLDELDALARRLYEFLRDSDPEYARRPRRQEPGEPAHPVALQAERWRRAIVSRDATEAAQAASHLQSLMASGHGRHPILARLVAQLSFTNRLSQENLVPLTALKKAVE